MKKTKAIAVRKNKQPIVEIRRTPVEIIQAAVLQKGGTIADLKEMLAFQKDWEANESRKLFNASFTQAQAEIQAVTKTRTNEHTHSKYADLSAVIESAKPVYTKHGFAVIFYETDCPLSEHIRVCADVLHRAGHKETYHYDVPLDGKGIEGKAMMTKIHGKSSSVAYGRRYLMCMIWNIPTQDDDGNGGVKGRPVVTESIEVISDKERSQIIDCLVALKKTEKSFCALMKIPDLEKLPKDSFKKAMDLIKLEAERTGIKLC
jgi:hypothetical protein